MNLIATSPRTRRGSGIVLACLLALPALLFAQLPTPTYGWNLGNTLEPPTGEGTWGPAATRELIRAVAGSGFNTIRLPVAWDSHANASTHEIDPAWMVRVRQVVDWCYAENLYVIINCHWDNGWFENHITDAVDGAINAKMQSYWTQIATAFAGYDQRLLFAAANEPNCDSAAKWATLRSYYNTFISAVRATGGNNTVRWLIVQGPNTNIDLSEQLVASLPNDPTPGRLAFEVHYYDPYQWTIMPQDESWGKTFYFWGQAYHHATRADRNASWGEESYVNAQFQKMVEKFVIRGVPVIVGEFTAIKRSGRTDLTGADFKLHVAARTYFHKYVVDAANSRGLKPIYWDIAGQMFDWTTGAVIDPDNVKALTGGAALRPLEATLVPAAPSGLTATASSSSEVSLAWVDGSTNEESFQLERATNSTFTSDLVTATLPANTTSRTVSGLASATTYYFRVRASASAGSSAYSNTASVTTLTPTPPPSPSGGSSGSGGGGGAPSAWFVGAVALAALMRRRRPAG